MSTLYITIHRYSLLDVWIEKVWDDKREALEECPKGAQVYALTDERFNPGEHYYYNKLWPMGIYPEYVEHHGKLTSGDEPQGRK